MNLIAIIVVGFLAGLIARALVPGDQPMSLLGTTGLGIAGSFVGGLLGSFLYTGGQLMTFHPSGLLFSVMGSMIVLGLVMFTRGRARTH